MRNKQRIHITGNTGSVVGQRHRRPADNEDVGDYSAPDQSLTQGSERVFQFFPVEEYAVRFGHAASRSTEDRYTPCLRKAAGARTRASVRWTLSSAGNHGRRRTRISAQAGGARSSLAARCSASAARSASQRSSPEGSGSSPSRYG